MKTIGAQLAAGEQLTSPWTLTAVGSFVIRRSDVEEAGGSRKVVLPNSSLRIADLSWEPVKDVGGKVVLGRIGVALVTGWKGGLVALLVFGEREVMIRPPRWSL